MQEFSGAGDGLPTSVYHRIDAVCVRFEEAWRSGRRPRLSDFLGETAGPERTVLLRELLLLDIHYRRTDGETPRIDDYLHEFPRDDSLLRELLCPPSSRPAPTTDQVDLGLTVPVLVRRARRPREKSPLPGFHVLGELGRGAMGVVYKAWQLDLKRYVALKMILGGEFSCTEQITRFQTEVEAIARLKHPGIVQVYQVGTHRGLPFCVLEYVEGGTLAEKLKRGLPTTAEVARLIEQIARAVHAIHQCRVMHRDLKPGNVLLSHDGTPKITDFGLAKFLDSADSRTLPGGRIGTPSYMAPEQAEGRVADVGPWTDLYALGAILYECLTGQPPFTATDKKSLYRQISQNDPLSPRKRNPAVSRDLETICLKCLQKEPSRRYATALDLADDLLRCREGHPIQARPVRTWEQAIKLVRRRPLQVALAVSLAVAVVGMAVGGLCYGLYKDAQNQVLENDLRVRQQLVAELTEAEAAHAGAAAELRREGGEQEAEKKLTRAADLLRSAQQLPGDAADREKTAALLHQLSQTRKRLESRQSFRLQLDCFNKHRDQALLAAVRVTGRDEAATRKEVRQLARHALAAVNVSPDQPTEGAGSLPLAAFAEHTSPARLRQLALDCYELLQVWVEMEARPPAGATEAQRRSAAVFALRVLETAETLADAHSLDVSRRFLHARRQRCLQALGQATDAKPRGVADGQPTATDLFLDAQEAFSRQKPDAVARCEKVLQRAPGHFWGWYLRALCHLQARKWEQARLGLDNCLAQRPGFLWARLFRATAESELGHERLAEEDFAAVLAGADDPDLRYLGRTNRAAHWLRSNQAGKWLRAEEDLKEAIRIQPESYMAYVNLAWLYRQQKQPQQALDAITRAINRRPTALTLYLTRARINADLDRQAARRDYARVVGEKPDPSGLALWASASIELASLECQDGQHPEALRHCDGVLQALPSCLPAHRQRAHALLALKEYEKAGEELDRYLAAIRNGRGQPDPEAQRTRGHIHVIRREYAEALAAYTEALAQRRDADTLFRRGSVFLLLGKSDRALADFDSALRLNPGHTDSLFGRAEARLRLDQAAQAATDAEAAVKLLTDQQGSPFPAVQFYARAIRFLQSQQHGRRALTNLAEPFRVRALDLLDDSLRSLPREKRKTFWHDSVEASTDLAVLRPAARFQALAARYGRR